MKPTNYFILAAMSAGYLGSLMSGILNSWTWSLLTWVFSMLLAIMAVMELGKDKDKLARAMTGSWVVACIAGTMSHGSLTLSMALFLPVLVVMAAWAWYIRREILISHSSGVLKGE